MSTPKIAFCFPGQGSLEAGMGREIALAVPAAMEVYERASEASGLDLVRLCFEAPEEELVHTEVQQPALVATSLAVLAALRENGFELGADGSGGPQLYLPAGGSRTPASAESVAGGMHFVQMNGREVFKFATRVLVSSAEAVLAECGKTIEDVDVYVPHQANVRIIEHARQRLGIPEEKTVIDVDRYGNTSSGSIPLALGDAKADGRLHAGQLVLMTGMGAGLTWGSGLIEWTAGGEG